VEHAGVRREGFAEAAGVYRAATARGAISRHSGVNPIYEGPAHGRCDGGQAGRANRESAALRFSAIFSIENLRAYAKKKILERLRSMEGRLFHLERNNARKIGGALLSA